MKKTLALAAALVSSLAFGATTVPVQLLSPAGSTSGQAIVSTGASSAPQWFTIPATGAANTWTAKQTFSGGYSATSGAMNNGLTTAQAIYSAIFPGVTFTDETQSVFKTATSNPYGQQTAVGAYVQNVAPATGINGNAVALFGAGTAEVNNAATWGVNTLLQDATSRVAGSGTGRILTGHEADFNVMNPGTQVIGFSAGGNSLAQPTTANAYIVNSLGTGYKWTGGFLTVNGAAQTGMSLGMASATLAANVNSQPALFQIGDGNGTAQNVSLTATSGGTGNAGGYLVLGGSSTQNNLSITNGNIAMGNANSVITLGGIPAVGVSTARMKATNGSGQSIPTGTTTTLTGWTAGFDQTSSFVTSTGVFTAPYTAYYQIHGELQFNGTSFPVGTTISIAILVSGTSKAETILVTGTAAQTGNTIQVDSLEKITSGQTITLTVYQNSGAAAALNTSALHNNISIFALPG